MEQKYFYVKVVEAKGVIYRSEYFESEPFVVIKVNGKKFINRKKSKYRHGNEWWSEIFLIKCKNIERDFITIEIRDKGYHFFRSDWVGEVHLNISDYVDGKVHQQWYKLGEALVKKHISKPRGFIRIQTQLLDDPYQRPFATPPVEPILSFDEWKVKAAFETVLNPKAYEEKFEEIKNNKIQRGIAEGKLIDLEFSPRTLEKFKERGRPNVPTNPFLQTSE